MAFLRTTVTGSITLPDGSPMPNGAKILFTLRSWDKNSDTVAVAGVTEATVTGGAISVSLIRTAATDRQTLYDVGYAYFNPDTRKAVSGYLGRIAISGTAALDIADILAVPAPLPDIPDALAQALAGAAAAIAASQSANTAALLALVGTGTGFDSVQQMLASTFSYGTQSLQHNGQTVSLAVVPGGRWTTKEGFAYDLAASAASDHHLQTDGGVKLYYRPVLGEIHLAALNPPLGNAGDCSAALRLATRIARSLAGTTIAGRTGLMPQIILPNGTVRFTEAGTLSDAMTGNVSGLKFIGAGRTMTQLIYDNTTSPVETSHALDTGRITHVTFEGMTIVVRNGKRFILHYNNAGSGGGAWLAHKEVIISHSTFDRYLDISGTSLGSEVFWQDVEAIVPPGGTLVYVRETNPQSLNHNCINCTFNAYGAGTIFRFRAGGNLRWLGGFGSFGDGAKFLVVDPPVVGLVGTGNWDYTFIGWHPENISTGAGDFRIVETTRGAKINFISCNLGLLRNANGFATFSALQTSQDTVDFGFQSCWLSSNIKFALAGAANVWLDDSYHFDWATHVVEYSRLESSSYHAPRISVTNPRKRDVLPADPFLAERAAGRAHAQPVAQPGGVPVKAAIFREGANGNNNGLRVGLGSTYSGFAQNLPLGSIIKSVTLVFIGPNGNLTQERRYRVTNHDETVAFLPEQIIPAAQTASRHVFSSTGALMYVCDTPAKCAVVVSGQTASGAAGSALDDFGYVVVEYY